MGALEVNGYAIEPGANLKGAKLAGTNLTRADLTRADLTRADLTQANLTGANLAWAILRDANLTGANLSGANLSGAILDGANWLGASVSLRDLDWDTRRAVRDARRAAKEERVAIRHRGDSEREGFIERSMVLVHIGCAVGVVIGILAAYQVVIVEGTRFKVYAVIFAIAMYGFAGFAVGALLTMGITALKRAFRRK